MTRLLYPAFLLSLLLSLSFSCGAVHADTASFNFDSATPGGSDITNEQANVTNYMNSLLSGGVSVTDDSGGIIAAAPTQSDVTGVSGQVLSNYGLLNGTTSIILLTFSSQVTITGFNFYSLSLNGDTPAFEVGVSTNGTQAIASATGLSGTLGTSNDLSGTYSGPALTGTVFAFEDDGKHGIGIDNLQISYSIPPTGTTPEPASMAMLGMAALSFGGYFGLRRRKQQV